MAPLVETPRAWSWKVGLVRNRRHYWVQHPAPDPALQHRSQAFEHMARIAAGLGVQLSFGQAVSQAGLSFLGGAPRNPNLKPGAGPEYSTVRIAEGEFSYTTIGLQRDYCSRCGRATLERHTMEVHHEASGVTKLGHVEGCSYCDRDGWMFKTHGPWTEAARKRAEKTVP